MIPYSKWKQQVNEAYYTSRGKRYRDDFATLSREIGTRWGKAFKADCPCAILERGPGDGDLAHAFLSALDPRTYSQVTYYLSDFSELMCSHARENLSEFKERVKVCSPRVKFDRIHFNELWDDLLTERLLLLKGTLHRLYVENRELSFKPTPEFKQFKKYLVEGYCIPIPVGALELLANDIKILNKGGVIVGADYGFRKEVFSYLTERVSQEIEYPRRFGDQITDDVYFDVILGEAKVQGLCAEMRGSKKKELMGFFEVSLSKPA